MAEKSPFISILESLKERKDKGALAKLQRGLGKEFGDVEMYPYVVPFLPKEKSTHSIYFLVAALFGMHQLPTQSGESMGCVFSQLKKTDSREKRFKALLNTHEDELAYHLRQVVSMAKSNKIEMDYHRLLRDLLNWTHPERFVQLEWAKDFWTE